MSHKCFPSQWTVGPIPCCEKALSTYALSWSLPALRVVGKRLNFQPGRTEDCFLVGLFPSACLSHGQLGLCQDNTLGLGLQLTFLEVKIPCEAWEGVTRQRVLWISDDKIATD